MFDLPVARPTWPDSLWKATAGARDASPVLQGDMRADVTVIGAGFTGLRCALALAEAGSRVVVLDAGDVGWGASGRNGGQVNPMLPHNTPAMLHKILGATYFDRLTQASLTSADELFALIRQYGIACKPRQAGWLRVNHNATARRNAEAGVKAWNTFGAGMYHVDGPELERISGSRAYASGVVTPRGGAVQPLMLARGVASAAIARGTQIFGQSPVTALRKDGDVWRATTPGGSVTSDWVVVATNGYSGELLPGLAASVLPLTPIQIATEPLPDEVVDSILPEGHTISDSRRVIMYARREADNRMVYGGVGKPRRDGTFDGFDWLIRDAERVFPQLKGQRWRYRWGGQVAVTDDHLPHLHEPRSGMLVGLGYNGRGVALSHVMGRVMAERILGADPAALPFPVTQARAFPLGRTKRLGLATAVRLMKLMDYLETR
ncbi:FAD-binding oxidoreductase [Pseudooceanicola sediminis]|uniref:FAD-binding oxidoreductase n=1 Tax=Pseudooceanicola sediminis TaxID=2211117 RepID=A0A399J7G8_9RHOB|nr:FAD-binding oxidoreductase [Pseudooceanicola sediminis]KAA2315622.1 FAD-binding oxidoreductase [Puniceibacterium sp. HSS470]RII40179.1 FAD-binding oxidoreductase [Pseudooceanicola sediminis]|tara:strand:- start:114802 stop:116106 length:1305 start_codon:yes stop_codon:yes gene_type:complete